VIDEQVPRCAYTLNEALCPRNKFTYGFQGAVRVYKYVNAGRVRNSSDTILGTEFPALAALVEGTGEVGGGTVCKSHRPVHGYASMADGGYDMSLALVSPGRPGIRRVTVDDLQPDPQPPGDNLCRLDWVGRNHSAKREANKLTGKSNFLYADGHVETKDIRDTLTPIFQWGEEFYSLSPGDDIAQ
jgi:prepilin-type processing-associated H-X9-DG protein